MSSVGEIREWPSRLATVRRSTPAVLELGGHEVAEVMDPDVAQSDERQVSERADHGEPR